SLWCAGALTAHAAATFGPAARRFADAAALAAALAEAPEAASLLVKGSRFMRMERVVRAIEDAVEREVAGGPAAEGGEDDACC
ncbi:MAG: UDP-N-acetylmuramoylalanyl-D-glutamyl-2, 6-diaminopimelate--D-alanyl-D-alanine ligase, partial [Rhodoferax sp.]|nr:UDP-N-acetylmuramoylalanyl-D-glutamyl-2, 6-diaminopimelate--D-alanyl-D-alanine ligase [Rhodoferax sp.]